MWVYYMIFSILALFSFSKFKENASTVLSLFLFSVFYVFKARVGTDYAGYEFYYNHMNGLSDLSIGGFELGYNSIALLFRTLNLPFQLMCIVLSAFVVLLFYKATKEMELELGLTLFLSLYFIFYPTFETLRQEIAIILFYYSLSFLIDDNALKRQRDRNRFFICNFIGFLFHRTAIIAFIFYFYRKYKPIKLFFIAFCIFFVSLQPILLSALTWFPSFHSKLSFYLWAAKQVSGGGGELLSFKLMEYTTVCIILLLLKSKSKLEDIALNLVEIGIILQLFLKSFIGVAYRLIYFCDIGMLLFYTTFLTRIKNKSLKLLYIFVLIVYLGVRFARVFPFDNDAFIYNFLY